MGVRTFSGDAQIRAAKRRFVSVDGQCIHYRIQGTGPAIVMLHDSPRSSRLHLPTMANLSDKFTVVALDTPGYGNSDPLPITDPEISDFAKALHRTLEALGLAEAPLYATHTSAKIALEYAARYPLASVLILDGISIPETPTPQQFIESYMRPFTLDADGGFLAREWTRIRDMIRWFPWFNKSVQTRIPLEVAPDWLQDYSLDLFSAGADYSGAYSAAMRYAPLPALRRVSVPTIVTARKDDVLYKFLEHVPLNENENLKIHPLPADPDTWLIWLRSQFEDACIGKPVYTNATAPIAGTKVYVDAPDGQVLVHRRGPASKIPLLVLDAPSPMNALYWAAKMPADMNILVPELPGFGESDALSTPNADAFVESLVAIIDVMTDGTVDLLATGLSTSLAMKLAAQHPDKVARLVVDGGYHHETFLGSADVADLVPAFSLSNAGAHLHQIWHMLRDSQTNWPWFDGRISAQRHLQPQLEAEQLYESFLGILKQPERYGDSVRANTEAAENVSLSAIRQPCLIFEHPTDGAYKGAAETVLHLPDARLAARPSATADAVTTVLSFLSEAPCPAISTSQTK